MLDIKLVLWAAALLCQTATAWDCSDVHSVAIPDSVEPLQISECFREILERGDLEEVSKLNANINELHVKYLVAGLESEVRRLGLLQRELILGESVLEPVIKWGQNISHVFINIKTSHRWDSPPCLNSKTETAFLNETRLEYLNVCIVSQQKLTFALRINLHALANVAGEKGEYGRLLGFAVAKNGVGMYSATFEKLEYDIWPYLDRENTSYAIWTEMAERYPSDHRKYEELSRFIAAKQKRSRTTKHEMFVALCFGLLALLLSI